MTSRKRNQPLSDTKPRSGAPPGCLVFVFAVFLAGGALTGKVFLLDPLLDVLAARSWAATPCVVLSSDVMRHPGNDGETFSVAVRFRYAFGGATYESARYGFEPGSSSGYDGKKEVVDRHPAGLETTCWVDPGDPSRAVLDRGLGAWAWFALFPVPFFALGAGGIWWVVRSRRKEKRDREEREGRPRGAASRLARDGSAKDPGPVTLKPRLSRGLRAAGAGFVAVFWNGIVAAFAAYAANGWANGESPWLLTLFLVPFVLVGLGLLLAFLKALRAVGSPRPVLKLEPARVPLGGSASLSWSFPGRAPAVSVFQVTLEGSEEAQYSRGSERATDRSLFHRSDLVLTLDPSEARAGSALVSPPAATVPSLSAPSNRIVWLLRLTAQIHGREDVKEEYEIAVVPPDAGARAGR